jgi:hypothetical protein
MADLTIFCPTKGRPFQLLDFGGEFNRHLREDTKLILVFDEDDDYLPQYISENDGRWEYFIAPRTFRGMVGPLNHAYSYYQRNNLLGFAVGFMGDDHRPRTPGWDSKYLYELRNMGTGFVYGNDLFQFGNMPTQVAFTSDIPATLGYMCPPEFWHLCVDVVWMDWGKAIDRIVYLEDTIVEHMHPLAGKSRDDKNYRAVNSNMMAEHDGSAYNTYHDFGRFDEDVTKLKSLL